MFSPEDNNSVPLIIIPRVQTVERLLHLKQEIAAGTYHVPTGSLVLALMHAVDLTRHKLRG